MYKGLKVNELIESRKMKIKEFQDALGISYNSYRAIVDGNPTVNTLEKVADFFNVPMDLFFDREISLTNTVGNISGTGHKIQNGQNNVMQESQEKEITHLKELLKEKERLIQVLMKK
jgi:transcriptional regulator with XRE-family HTH domain